MFATLEAKLIAAGLAALVLIALESYVCVRLLDAGAARCEAQIAAKDAAAEAQAQSQSLTWAAQLKDAEVKHATEIDQLAHVALTPTTVSVRKYTIAAGGPVPAVSAPAAGSSTAPAAGSLPGCVLPGPSDGLQREFDRAREADTLNADYRELYNSWPTSTSKTKP